jgi:outer membrane protein assembly factor BamB
MTSMPAVGEDRIFVGTIRGLYAIRKKDGSIDWRFKKGVIYHHISASPVIKGDRLFAGSDDRNKLYCINKNSGREIWSRKLSGEVDSSPAIYQGRVYIGSDDRHIYCFEAKSGKKVWSYRADMSIMSTPAVANESLVVNSGKKWLCLNAKSGRVRWTFNGNVQNGSACIYDGSVYLRGSGKAGNTKHHIYCLDLKSGEKKWEYDHIALPSRTPVVDASGVYVGGLNPPVKSPIESGYLFRINDKNGQLIWKRQMPYDRILFSERYDTLAIGASNLILSGEVEDHTAVFSYDKENGKLNWKTHLEGFSRITPVMDDGRIYACDHNTIYCISAGSEEGSWPVFRGNKARTGSPQE